MNGTNDLIAHTCLQMCAEAFMFRQAHHYQVGLKFGDVSEYFQFRIADLHHRLGLAPQLGVRRN